MLRGQRDQGSQPSQSGLAGLCGPALSASCGFIERTGCIPVRAGEHRLLWCLRALRNAGRCFLRR